MTSASAREPSPRSSDGQRLYLHTARQITSLIKTERLAAGSQLPPDHELADSLGVSRSAVREAFFVLEVLGVLVVRHGVGVFVADPDSSQPHPDRLRLLEGPKTIVEARSKVEPVIAALCAGLPDEERRSWFTDQRASLSNAEAHDLNDLIGFHRILAEACGNAVLRTASLTMMATDKEALWLLLNAIHLNSDEFKDEQEREHRRILDAIVDGDARAARDEMRKHLESVSLALFGSAKPQTSAV